MDAEPACRAIVLCSEGKSFCAGAAFSGEARAESNTGDLQTDPLYSQAVRLFAARTPVVAAIQGPAIGGGLGVALVADFRVAAPEARFAANFVKIGIHPGFGLTHTLPRLLGEQKAALLMLTGRRLDGATAVQWGLADQLSTAERVREDALALAAEIAEGAPLAIVSTRATLRDGLAEAVAQQTKHERAEQDRLFRTEDHREGVRAVAERRVGNFLGR
jgi:enoyl-CoA hydratase/carnithine racemase